jgi:GNAT superfamily N-acetyltransferase
MLVNLYDHSLAGRPLELAEQGITIKRGLAADKDTICGYVAKNFGTAASWVNECEVCLSKLPTSCFIAVHNNSLIGFCCYDGVAKGILGPIGVSTEFRRKGVASELLYHALEGMKSAGYAYAVIAWVSSEDFYKKTCGAVAIPHSSPGVYSRLISQSGER